MGKELAFELAFSISGEFVTKIAREWFWLEHQPWEKVEKLLLSCMRGTDRNKKELQQLARDVVFGKTKFIGSTADGSYALTDDDKDLVIQNVDRLNHEVRRLNNYGWLEPNGTFHPVEFAEHQSWAYDYIMNEPQIYQEYRKTCKYETISSMAGDLLTERGWVLLHNPGRGVAFVTKHESRTLTKAPKKFLFDYYTDRGKHKLAKKYLEAEE